MVEEKKVSGRRGVSCSKVYKFFQMLSYFANRPADAGLGINEVIFHDEELLVK